MPDKANDSVTPDADAIISEIEGSVDAAHKEYRQSPPAPGDAETGLQANLDAANKSCLVGRIRSGGLAGLVRRIAHRVLGSLISDINEYNSRTVRVLNKIVQRQDDQIVRHEARIRKLEEQAGINPDSEDA